MLLYDFTNQFKKDLKLLEKRGRDLEKIHNIIVSLIWEEPLPERCREHKLHGDWEGFTECHIEGDWIMIYVTDDVEKINFSFTGTHSDYL
ncbi:MAG: type II toxin-antitoxin system YafQ family toxin [Treponema sp.]|nr:type II toxin-antitoxin system YafQ family toxin [Treponema sp.]